VPDLVAEHLVARLDWLSTDRAEGFPFSLRDLVGIRASASL
jgi:hypothetical protein